jgi:DNA-binding response OmpR family regulator
VHDASLAGSGPQVAAVATVADPTAVPATASAAAPSRILVVDDNRDAADSLAFLLRREGSEVRVAYDGMDALGSALEFRPDVVLLDVGLPKLYGHEVARRIRESRGAEVMIVAVTGWGQEEDRRRTREAGFDHHLTKPVAFEKLRELLARPRAAPTDAISGVDGNAA